MKIALQYTKPPIWRRILVSSNVTLGRLHDIIQTVFDWSDAHLHQFIVGDTYYGVPHPDYGGWIEIHDERQVRLREVAPGEGSRFVYEYDFGDSWQHLVLVEEVLPASPGIRYPVCIKGRRACPPEDIGGIPGYYMFLEAMEDPDHPEHGRYVEWFGEDFDPDEFDVEACNEWLENFR
ncbi:MAG: plasmid pRiA4b ORF-3 family protein [Anaerolineae bacterium]